MKPKLILTVPPYANFLKRLAKDPDVKQHVGGYRLNTVMQLKTGENKTSVLTRMRDELDDERIWVDLKARQLRTAEFCVPPFAGIRLTQRIKCSVPTTAYFKDGTERATVEQVDGDMLIMRDGPRRVVGPGESINIPDANLEVEGFFTDTDMEYIQAAWSAFHTATDKLPRFMVSFIEGQQDLQLVDTHIGTGGHVLLKIESRKGVDFVKSRPKLGKRRHLMAARGDLFVEMGQPHRVLDAVRSIVDVDPLAVCASRFFNTMANGGDPSCSDVSDVAYHLDIGYGMLMLGDELCTSERSMLNAVRAFGAIVGELT